MTVSTLTNKVTYIGNGSATSFAVPFKVLDEDHLVVRRRLLSTNEIDNTYIGTDYSYSGIGDDAGTLTLDGTALSSLYQLEIERVVPYTQALDIVNAGGFYPETVEEQLDLTTMQVQQIAAQSDDVATRALMVPVGETAPDYADFADAFKGDPGGNVMAIGLFSAASLLTIAVGTDLVQTSGHTTLGYGAARYVLDEDVTHDAAWVAAHPNVAFISANARTFILDETQFLTDGMIGCLPDCDQDAYTGTDIAPLLEEFWDAFEYHVDFALIATTPPIQFGDGDFLLGSELEPRRVVRIYGTCSGHNNFVGGTRWHSPVDTRALTINIQFSGGGTKLGAAAGTAEGSEIVGIQFISQGGTDEEACAVWLRGRANIEKCIFGEYRNADLTKGKWPGNAVQIIGNTGSVGADYGNANNWRMRDNYVERCDGHGLYVSGTDANAGSCIGFETRLCGGCGIFDESGLGNTYVDYDLAGFANGSPLKGRVTSGGRHYQLIKASDVGTVPGTDNNTWYDMGAAATWPAWSALTTYTPDIPILCLGTSNRSNFNGGYSEGGASHIQAPAIAKGGQMGFTTTSSVMQQNQIGSVNALMAPTGMGGSASYLSGQPGYLLSGAVTWTIVGGEDPTVAHARSILQHMRSAASGSEMIWGWSGENMILRFNGQANYFLMSGPLTTLQFGTGAAVPYKFGLTDPVLIDPTDVAKSRIIGIRDTIPTTGAHARGEIVFNSLPAAAGTVGWVCVTAGTPGTWKTFGTIAA